MRLRPGERQWPSRVTRARDAGFDMCFFNLHKTFSTPHGCGGPACGAVGCSKELEKFLPAPLIGFDGEKYFYDYETTSNPSAIGKIREFNGVAPVVLKAYAGSVPWAPTACIRSPRPRF